MVCILVNEFVSWLCVQPTTPLARDSHLALGSPDLPTPHALSICFENDCRKALRIIDVGKVFVNHLDWVRTPERE